MAASELPSLGERIREERMSRGVSLRALAGQVGVSASMISQIENGKSQPSVSTLYAITSALGVSPPVSPDGEEGAMTRINLRLAEHLKGRIEEAAVQVGLSVNAWLVRAAAAALEPDGRSHRSERRAPQGGQRYTGWVR